MEARRNAFVAQRQRRFDQAGDTCRRIQVADVPLNGTDSAKIPRIRAQADQKLLSRGLYQMKPSLPFVPGVEVAGRCAPHPRDRVTRRATP